MKKLRHLVLLTVLFTSQIPLWAAHVINGSTRFIAAQEISNKNGTIDAQVSSSDTKNPDVTQLLGGITTVGEEWVEYDIDVQKVGSYNLYPRVATTNTWAFDVKIDGTKVASFGDAQTGGWNVWSTVRHKSQTITLTEGAHKLRLEFTTGKLNLNLLYFELDEILMDTHLINETGVSRVIAARDIFGKHESITTANCTDAVEVDVTRALNNFTVDRWIEYRIAVQKKGSYKIYPRIATTNANWSFGAYIDGTSVATFTGVKTGGWAVWETQSSLAKSVSLEAGTHTLRLEPTQGTMNLNVLYFEYDDTGTSLLESQLENDVKVYPTQVRRGQDIQVELQSTIKETALIDLYDLTGKRISSFETEGDKTYFPAPVNSGLYLLKITSKEVNKEVKIVVL